MFFGPGNVIYGAYGFKGLKVLNIVAVPLLMLVCLYGLVLAISSNNGLSILATYKPETNMGLVFGINFTIATFALGRYRRGLLPLCQE